MALKKLREAENYFSWDLSATSVNPIIVDDIVNGDFSIYGSFGYTSIAWTKTVSLLNSGELDLTFIVTHRFALTDWQSGFDALVNGPAPRGKILLLP